MTSHISNRVTNVAARACERADLFDEIANTETTCERASNVARFAAESLRSFARQTTGDINAKTGAKV